MQGGDYNASQAETERAGRWSDLSAHAELSGNELAVARWGLHVNSVSLGTNGFLIALHEGVNNKVSRCQAAKTADRVAPNPDSLTSSILFASPPTSCFRSFSWHGKCQGNDDDRGSQVAGGGLCTKEEDPPCKPAASTGVSGRWRGTLAFSPVDSPWPL